MGSKALASTALLVSLNLLFFSLVSSTYTHCPNCICPKDNLNLNACVDLLGFLNLRVNSPDTYPCCSLIQNLLDVDAAVCLCSTISVKLPILGSLLGPLYGLTIPVSLELLFNACSRQLPCNY
ncbi:hypothetical protein EZV62_023641 [Acer yangbiense]|uniref:Hydrophobic seed protein domain-containing protein n=1 Tax=Acer yangbiense TaxID=1000413 RepID=A0A5C7H2N5_9ROSI|nr:hypothetical protein EZV62_023641 [Acer yangbiense]